MSDEFGRSFWLRMSDPPITAEQYENTVWDVLVIGTGMGGGTLGHALAQSGKRVLFVEKGLSNIHATDDCVRDRLPDDRADFGRMTKSQRVAILASGGRSVDEVEDVSHRRSVKFMPFIGGGTGGSSALYGMALERLFAADFVPRSNHADAGTSSLPESWPIDYQQFRPWYAAAEQLYRVHGTPDPLRSGDTDSALLSPPPLTPGSAELCDHFRRQGLHPYQLHIGCEHLPDCQTCQGYLCPRSCKNDSGRICVLPAIEQHGAQLLTECQVERLEADRTQVTRVICRHRDRQMTLRARYVVLAAGALITPVLLLQSRSADWPTGLANQSDMVGRNLMRHCIDLLMVMLNRDEPITGQTKELALNDFYHADGQKLGTVQSFGPLPPISYFLNQPGRVTRLLSVVKPLLNRWGEHFRSRGLVFTTIMEDLPYRENRVLPADLDNGSSRQRLRMHYQFHDSERRRLKQFRKNVERSLQPYKLMRLRGAADNKAIAHVCGTCRFGDDPRTSVADRDCRAHGLDNLYVVDASIFPSSGGLNPSLTIAANALRVAEHLKSRL